MGIDSLRGDCVVFRVATVFDSQDLWLVCDQRFRIIRTQSDFVISLQTFDGQRVYISPWRMKPPRKRVEDRGLIFPGDLDRVWLAHNISRQYDCMRTTRLVVFRGRAQLHLFGFLAIRANRAHDKHPDFPAIR